MVGILKVLLKECEFRPVASIGAGGAGGSLPPPPPQGLTLPKLHLQICKLTSTRLKLLNRQK